MNNIDDLARLLISCWCLSTENTEYPEAIPTSHGLLDRALSNAIRDGAFQGWNQRFNFADSRIGLQCVELPDILDWAQKAQLTDNPNPSYQTVRVLVSQRVASRLLRKLGVTDLDEAREWGSTLRRAVTNAQDAFHITNVSVEH